MKLTGLFKFSSSFVVDDSEVPSDESKLFLGASTPGEFHKTTLLITQKYIFLKENIEREREDLWGQ